MLGLTLALAAAAAAQPVRKVPTIVFPVIGPTSYSDDFGDPRPGGRHEGNDILAPRKAIAVAAESGRVKFWTTSASAGCMLYLYGESGTTYLYIHLNNDLGSGNDNRGRCVAGTAYAPGMKNGAHVDAGQPVGFVGDSGDANGVHPHLHFEVHPKDGPAVDPFPYLNQAQHLLFTAPAGSMVTLTLTGTVLAATGAQLTLQVQQLRVFPTGTKLDKVGTPVTLGVPAGVLGTGIAPRLLGLKVIVLSEPVEATLATLAGKNLTAARVATAP